MRDAEVAELAAVQFLGQFPVGGVATPVQPHRHHLLGGLLHLHHPATLDNGVGQRLLAIDVFASLDRVDGHQRMPVVGRRHAHGVDVFVFRTHPTLRCSPCRRTRARTSDRLTFPDLKTASSYAFRGPPSTPGLEKNARRNRLGAIQLC